MKQLISILLSGLLLLSSTGITYAEHFCGSFKMLSKVTVGQEQLSCGMVVANDACEGEQLMQAMDCCDNHYVSVTTDDTYAKAHFEFAFTSVMVVSPIVLLSIVESPINSKTQDNYRYYRPPPNIVDIQVTYQTFLI